jgi:phospholipid/cholesterol/gamma-HCH transport system substrate-binding protein
MAASLIALAGLVVLFGGAPKVFSTDAKYTILYSEAPGIGPGIPIRKSGVRIGQVTDVELDPVTGQVRVRIAVDRKYLPRKNEDAEITRGLLSGDTAIDFLPRLDPTTNQPLPVGEVWPPGSEIPGKPPLTPRSILNPAASALAQAQQSLDIITATFDKFNKDTAPKVGRAADEAAELFKEIRLFVPELRNTNQRLQKLIGGDMPPKVGPVVPVGFMTMAQPAEGNEASIRALVRDVQEMLRTIKPAIDDFRATMRRLEPELLSTLKGARTTFESANDVFSPENRQQFAELLKNVNGVASSVTKFVLALGTVLDQAERTLKNIDTQVTQVGLVVGDVRAVTRPLSARAEGLVKSVADSADDLGKLIAEIRSVVGPFAKENGTIQKLITDPSLYRNIDDAAASLARIMLRAEKITRDLEVFADKVARRPELIGVGGAIHGSSGLKDLPGTPSRYRPDWPPAKSAVPLSGPSWLSPPEEPHWGPPPPIQGMKP